ncbi:MAG: 16S rRNA (guanine(527)-N(7))-methyltransferase RsmG [Clostridia bacterium]|nr:16S rRNA (guanine(527)-N(7))-methyltransferase RsmG [Clostridia bacterium]
MEKETWKQTLKEQAGKIDVILKEEQLEKFYSYMELLKEWNEKMNLTAITQPYEILQKHFIDSLTILPYLESNQKVIDVGTGAGFPGIPIKIANNEISVTLFDSLGKRISFLDEVIQELALSKMDTHHIRAEEAGKSKMFREQFDIAVSRAVAPLATLVEYLLPLVKIGGKCICMKTNKGEEIENSDKAISTLGGEIETIKEFTLPQSDIKRTLIIIKKIEKTPNQYPRKPGTPSKQPIQ